MISKELLLSTFNLKYLVNFLLETRTITKLRVLNYKIKRNSLQ